MRYDITCDRIYTKCISSCEVEINCVALEKIDLMYHQKLSLNISYDAFLKSKNDLYKAELLMQPNVIRSIIYFIQITEPIIIAEKFAFIQNDFLYLLLRDGYVNYLENKSNQNEKSFFDKKENRFWKYLPFDKIVSMVEFLLQIEDYKLASMFLLIINSEQLELLIKILNNKENEKRLFFSLEDEILILVEKNPKIYFYLLELFLDDDTGIYNILFELKNKAEDNLLMITELNNLFKYFNELSNAKNKLQILYNYTKNNHRFLNNNIFEKLVDLNIITHSEKEFLLKSL